MPLAADPSKAGRAAVGAVIVLAVAGLAYLVLRELADRNLITKLQNVSVRHNFGLEMRVSLAALFGLAGLAVNVHVSVMLAGFAFGLALSAVGTPRRLAGQLFAVTEGFLGPIFFIWLGASIDLRALADHPRLVVLALGLAVATIAIHALARLLGQPLPLAVLASAQLGVPVAAVALGAHGNLLQPGEGGAILGAAVLTLAAAAVCGGYARRTTGKATAGEATTVSTEAADDSERTAPAAAAAAETASVTTEATAVTTEARAVTAPAGRAVARKRPAARPKVAAVPQLKADPTNVTERAATSVTEGAATTAPPPARPATPNPASKPIVQSNVRVQPAPQRPEPTQPPRLPQGSRPARSDDDR